MEFTFDDAVLMIGEAAIREKILKAKLQLAEVEIQLLKTQLESLQGTNEPQPES